MRARRWMWALLFTTACVGPDGVNRDEASEGTAASQAVGADQFERGFPLEGTAQQVYDASDLRRAIEAYKVFVPTVATEAVIQQMAGQGARPNEMGMALPNQPIQQFQGTNSDTPYALTTLDLRAGPMVVEMPANPLLLGLVDDHNMTWVTDVGGIGPDQGRGGKHLFLPPGYDGDVPEGFFVSRSQTWELVVAIRTVPLDGDVPKSIEAAREVRVYPFSDPGEGATFDFIDVSDRVVPLPLLEWEGTLEYWRQLHAVIDSETAPPKYRRMLGVLAELGIEKGEPFDPSPRMVRILEQAAETAHREMSVSAYANRRQLMEWPDRRWERVPAGPFSAVAGDFGTAEVSDIDASDQYFFLGWGTSSSIGRREVGGGSMYYSGYRDGRGAYLDGGKSYKMTIPGPVPAALFWSMTVYDVETRCLIQTGQGRATVRSHLDEPQANPDGSYDVYFGPSAPEGLDSNWIQTKPGGGWWGLMRVYGPQEPAFDGTWRLGDIIEVG
jgi:hypothetical protein